MLDAADLPRIPYGRVERGVSVATLGGHARVFLDTLLFACGIEPVLTDAELRDYEQGADETQIGGA